MSLDDTFVYGGCRYTLNGMRRFIADMAMFCFDREFKERAQTYIDAWRELDRLDFEAMKYLPRVA